MRSDRQIGLLIVTAPVVVVVVAVSLAAVVLAACSGSHSSHSSITPVTKIHGSGVVVEQDRMLSGFSVVTFATHASLRITQGAPEALRIRAEDNLLPYLVTEVNNGTLAMRTASGVDLEPTQPIEFHLTVTNLERFTFTGVGNTRISDLTASGLSLTSSGIGSLLCSNLDAATLDVSLSGIGSMKLSGHVDAQVVRAAGFGDYEAENLTSRHATVTTSNMSSATVSVSDKLVATVAGSGSIYYIGNPIVESTVTGSGGVVRIR